MNGKSSETRAESEARAAKFYIWLCEYLDAELNSPQEDVFDAGVTVEGEEQEDEHDKSDGHWEDLPAISHDSGYDPWKVPRLLDLPTPKKGEFDEEMFTVEKHSFPLLLAADTQFSAPFFS